MSTSPNPNPAPAAPDAPSSGSPPASTSIRPEYIPEKFWDPASNAPKIEDLAKSYVNLETHQGNLKQTWEAERLAQRPEDPNKYEFTIEGFDKDTVDTFPLTGVLREAAFDLGLPQEQANGLASKIIQGLLKDMPDPVKEKESLGRDADARLQAVDAFVKATFTDPAEQKAFEFIGRNAAGVRAIEKLIALAKGTGGEPHRGGEGPAATGPKSKDELRKMMDDERYWHPQKKDRAYVDLVMREFDRANGGA